MYPSRFEYLPARSVGEAVGALARYGREAKVLAGGQSLIPMMKLRLAAPRVLIDISRLTHLAEIREVGPDLLIGAMVREAALERSAVAGRWAPGLVDTSRVIADPLVRNLATVGGNAAQGDLPGGGPGDIGVGGDDRRFGFAHVTDPTLGDHIPVDSPFSGLGSVPAFGDRPDRRRHVGRQDHTDNPIDGQRPGTVHRDDPRLGVGTATTDR